MFVFGIDIQILIVVIGFVAMALFTDVVQGANNTTAATAVALPSLTLPASARMITRIWVTGIPINFNVAEPFAGYVEVKSEDCGIAPMHIPYELIPGFITVGGSVQREPHKWVVNCECPGGAVLTFDSFVDVTLGAAGETQIVVEFTDGASPFGGGQIHMKSSEGADALGTADDTAIVLNNIDIKASRLLAIYGYAIATQPTADQACPTTAEITSDDFSENGPFRFAWNPLGPVIANGASGGVDLTVIETDRGFKSGGSKQTLKCTTTTRDAMTGDGVSAWGVVYN